MGNEFGLDLSGGHQSGYDTAKIARLFEACAMKPVRPGPAIVPVQSGPHGFSSGEMAMFGDIFETGRKGLLFTHFWLADGLSRFRTDYGVASFHMCDGGSAPVVSVRKAIEPDGLPGYSLETGPGFIAPHAIYSNDPRTLAASLHQHIGERLALIGNPRPRF